MKTTIVGEKSPRRSLDVLLDDFLVFFSGVASVWLAWLILSESVGTWSRLLYLVPFWVVLAYATLPRIHTILTNIYLPDYFIGRSRTTDGLLADPINLAFRGSQEHIEFAMSAAGWSRAEEISLKSSWRMVVSTVLRRSYPEAPVSTLKLFGRQQDFAYQREVDGNPTKRHHVRFWRCPEGWYLPGGLRVDWVAAGTFDKRVGFSLFTFQITHRIDGNIDAERDHIIRTLLHGVPDITISIIEDFSTGYHSRNGGGDTINTDGDLPVLDLSGVVLEWPVSPVLAREKAKVPGTDVVVPALARPFATSFGALFAVFTAITGVVGSMLALFHGQLFREIDILWQGINADQSWSSQRWFVAISVWVIGLLALLRLFLAYYVWRGKNWARIALTVTTSVAVIFVFLNMLRGERLTVNMNVLETNLITVTLEIFVLLALSSDKARAYARHRRP